MPARRVLVFLLFGVLLGGCAAERGAIPTAEEDGAAAADAPPADTTVADSSTDVTTPVPRTDGAISADAGTSDVAGRPSDSGTHEGGPRLVDGAIDGDGVVDGGDPLDSGGLADVEDATTGAFIHPGLLVSRSDQDRIKTMVSAGQEPWLSGYNILASDEFASSHYSVRGGFSTVVNDVPTNTHTNLTPFVFDSNAAYENALMYVVTGDVAHANKTIAIINAWSSTLTSIRGSDAQLTSAQQGFRLSNAAEIIRYANVGWAATDITRFETMLKAVVVPNISNYGDRNWGTGCVKAMIAIGIFTNDSTIYDSGINAFYTNACCSLGKIIGPTGQNTENGRDQIHAQINIGHLAEAAWVGWNQGVDLFAALGNRILAGYEYEATYMLGNSVPWDDSVQPCTLGPYEAITATNRGQFIPMYEIVYNHYTKRANVPLPFTEQVVLTKTRPEGRIALNYDGEHLIGWGTLTFALP
jgi:Alginate lyase